jgi:putative FmdB family regulatory protein
MPLYDFVCKCGHTKEEFVKLDQQEPVCDKCGLRMKRAVSAPAFILKGNCWAKDNYSLKKSNKNKDK